MRALGIRKISLSLLLVSDHQEPIFFGLKSLQTASGDLRNVLMTINNIPSEYPGKLSVVINDRHPRVAARNLLILLSLLGISDESLAADVALHLWYSAFIPAEYDARVVLAVQAVVSSIKNNSSGMNLDWGDEGAVRVIADFTKDTSMQFASYLQRDRPLDPVKAASELRAVMSVLPLQPTFTTDIKYEAADS
jgi:hypothetical protein